MAKPVPPVPHRLMLVGESLAPHAAALFEGGELAACGPVVSFGAAREAVRAARPDLVLVDLTSPEAIEAVEALLRQGPVRLLALHPGALAPQDAFRALALGALDVSERPHAPQPIFFRALARRLALLARVRVPTTALPVAARRAAPPPAPEPAFPLVAVAASLGGPRALGELLRELPRAFPAPVCICQHITAGFTQGLAHWLSQETGHAVAEARDGELLEPGRVYVAPSGSHLTVAATAHAVLGDGAPLGGFKPSCDVLLRSAADAFGRRAIGVVLTGMGSDGARGLRAIRQAGGRTVAQDRETSVVWGMPREAVELGGAQEVLPLGGIAPQLVRWVGEC